MIDKIYRKFFLISSSLYNSIGNIDSYNKIKQIEDEEYAKLTYEQLDKLYDSLEILCSEEHVDFRQPHELAYKNKKEDLILRRMLEKTFMFLNQHVKYDNEKSSKDEIKIDKNKRLIINNYDQALSEVYIKALNIIISKYLYFLDKNNELKEELKNQIKQNIYFMLPTMEDSQILDTIKNEAKFYDNLWDDVKVEYDLFIKDYLQSNISGMMNIMLYDTLNNLELNILNEIYLRTLFSYSNEETLEELNYKFNEMDLSKVNILGVSKIRKAFRSINNDTEAIQKIKNSR